MVDQTPEGGDIPEVGDIPESGDDVPIRVGGWRPDRGPTDAAPVAEQPPGSADPEPTPAAGHEPADPTRLAASELPWGVPARARLAQGADLPPPVVLRPDRTRLRRSRLVVGVVAAAVLVVLVVVQLVR